MTLTEAINTIKLCLDQGNKNGIFPKLEDVTLVLNSYHFVTAELTRLLALTPDKVLNAEPSGIDLPEMNKHLTNIKIALDSGMRAGVCNNIETGFALHQSYYLVKGEIVRLATLQAEKEPKTNSVIPNATQPRNTGQNKSGVKGKKT